MLSIVAGLEQACMGSGRQNSWDSSQDSNSLFCMSYIIRPHPTALRVWAGLVNKKDFILVSDMAKEKGFCICH